MHHYQLSNRQTPSGVTNCPLVSIIAKKKKKKSSSKLYFALGCRLSIVSCHMEVISLLLKSFFDFIALILSKIMLVQNRISLILQMLSCDLIQVMHVCQKYHRSDAVVFSLHAIRWFMILMFSIADHAYLTSALRWEFPGLSTEKLLFSLCN